MKRFSKTITATILSFCMMLSLLSCGKNNKTTATSANTSNSGVTPASALDLLNSIWSTYSENDQFPVSGGDEANLNFEGPGKFSVDNAEMLDSVLGLPDSIADKIDDAASLSHAMNANTFTCGVFRLKNASDTHSAAAEIKENILARHWICGFPDTMLIITAPGGYIISVWGIDEGTNTVSTFKQKVLGNISGASVFSEEPIV
jgi:hypothetical protein